MVNIGKEKTTRPFRHWADNDLFAPAVADDEEAKADPSGDNTFEMWPISEVETLLAAWGYDGTKAGWIEVDIVLWHHLNTLYSLFMAPPRGSTGPLEWRANDARRTYNYNRGQPRINSDPAEDERLASAMFDENTRNAQWIAEYALKWLETGLRLRESVYRNT